MNELDITKSLWQLALRKINEELAHGVSQTAIAERVGVRQPTITRWVKAERGEKARLREVVGILTSLGVTMDEIADALGEQDLANIMRVLLADKDLLKKMAAVAEAGGPGLKKIAAEVDYLYDQVDK